MPGGRRLYPWFGLYSPDFVPHSVTPSVPTDGKGKKLNRAMEMKRYAWASGGRVPRAAGGRQRKLNGRKLNGATDMKLVVLLDLIVNVNTEGFCGDVKRVCGCRRAAPQAAGGGEEGNEKVVIFDGSKGNE